MKLLVALLTAYASAGIAFGLLDFLWLRWAGPNLYRPLLGEILADKFRALPALAFYAIYLAGIVWFAVRPGLAQGVPYAVLNGALLGLLAYATFDLTSQAIFKVWSTKVTLIDMAWGASATALASGVACYAAIFAAKYVV
jgi:uncharacterized membrane protein